MGEVWLKPNRRALTIAWALCLTLTLILGAAAATVPSWGIASRLFNGVCLFAAWFLVGLGGLTTIAIAIDFGLPRVGYRNGQIYFRLRPGSPIAVPLEIVEAFLLGQASMGLPGTTKSATETRTVVVRLAEKATDWSQRRVNPLLGNWCDGYITIRGTWCEPLDVDVIKRLNRKLAQTTRSMQT